MRREHKLIPSEAMGRHMHLWCYGSFGAPLLVFPSASGMAHEWESHGMIEALEELIDGGKIKLYTAESNVAEAWTRKENDPAWKIRRHMAYERYVVDELVPFIRADCRSEEIPIAAAGTSLGALFSANFALKFPEIFRYALCMSGRYDVSWLTEDFHNADVYYNNPMAYVPNMNGDGLEDVRRFTHLALVCGQGKWEDGNIEETQAFAATLASKQIPHQLDLWGHDVAHEWAWWRRQGFHHLRNRFGG